MVLNTRLIGSPATRWRRLAEQAYKDAANMKTLEARRELTLVAKRYERLALHAEQQEELAAGSLDALALPLRP
jgi:hypothetical protein